MGTVSKRIDLEGLYNTRDLGGMIGAEGKKIKSGMLYRSGQLSTASESDTVFLKDHIGLVVDFRTGKEVSEKPDVTWEGVQNIWNPILEEAALGVTRESSTDKQVSKADIMLDPAKATAFMCHTYQSFFTDFGLSQYEKFVRMVLNNDNKATLWHCTTGKDRVGFASVIIQTILGVSKTDIVEDYLSTNLYASGEIQKMAGYMKMQMHLPEITEGMMGAMQAMFGVKEEYIQTIYSMIDEKFGSFENFLSKGLHLTDADIQSMRAKYLEA